MEALLQQTHADVNRLLLRPNDQRYNWAGDRHTQSAAQPSSQAPHTLPPPGLGGGGAQRGQRSRRNRHRQGGGEHLSARRIHEEVLPLPAARYKAAQAAERLAADSAGEEGRQALVKSSLPGPYIRSAA